MSPPASMRSLIIQNTGQSTEKAFASVEKIIIARQHTVSVPPKKRFMLVYFKSMAKEPFI